MPSVTNIDSSLPVLVIGSSAVAHDKTNINKTGVHQGFCLQCKDHRSFQAPAGCFTACSGRQLQVVTTGDPLHLQQKFRLPSRCRIAVTD
eukprot:5953143-Amphidinium_carterae.1